MTVHPRKQCSRRIFAFYGCDLVPGTAPVVLGKAVKQGYELLALDSAALAAAVSVGGPYLVVDDLVDAEGVRDALEAAIECGIKWFEPARDEFTVDGVCLPEVDCGKMRYFWRDALLALRVADALRRSRIGELRFFRHFSPRPLVGTARSDVAAVMWQEELGTIAKPMLTFDHTDPRYVVAALKRAVKRALHRESPHREETRGPSADSGIPGKIFVVMASVEAKRFSHIVTELAERFPDSFAVALLKPYPGIPAHVPWPESVPIVYGPHSPSESWIPATLRKWSPRGRSELAQRFLAAYFKAVEAAEGRAWHKPLKWARFHFAHYCLYRWPWLNHINFGFWIDLWARARPRVVLASCVEDTPFRIACAAAVVQGIPTMVLPHGGVIGVVGAQVTPICDYALYSNAMQKNAYELAGLPESRVLPCKGLVARNEYPVKEITAFSTRERTHVLALTDTTDEGVNLAKIVTLKAQYEALKALTEPPADLADEVDLSIKVHPAYQDLDLIAAVGPHASAEVLPPEADLHSALQETDLVVAVNYYGSALIHVLWAGKPVIYLLTEGDPLLNMKTSLFGLFTEGVSLARNSEELWNLVRSFLRTAAVGDQMRAKARDFASKALDDSDHPELGRLIRDLFPAGESGSNRARANPVSA